MVARPARPGRSGWPTGRATGPRSTPPWPATGLAGWESKLPSFTTGDSIATRVASATCVNALVAVVPGLMPGAADLTGNTGVKLKEGVTQSDSTRRAAARSTTASASTAWAGS